MSFLNNEYGNLNYSYYCKEYQKYGNEITDISKLENERAIYQKEFQRDLEFIDQHKSHLFSSLDLLIDKQSKEFSIWDFIFARNIPQNDSDYNQKLVNSIKYQVQNLIKEATSLRSMKRLTDRFNLTIESVYPIIKDLIPKSELVIDLEEFDTIFKNLFQCCQSAKNLSDKIEAIDSTRAKFIEKQQKKELERLKKEGQNRSFKTTTDGRVRWQNYKGFIQEKWEEAKRFGKNQKDSVKYVQNKVLEKYGDEIPEEKKGGPSIDTILRYNGIKKD